VTLTLYDNPVSSNALKVRFLLAELEVVYERVRVPFARPRPRALSGFHPLGTIPALVDGELRLGESNAILRYLAVREARDDLYPSQPEARACVDWALDTWSIQIRPRLLALELAALLYRDEEGGGGTPADADQGRVAAALDPARDALREFESFVAGDGYVLDQGFSLADCAVAPALWRSWRLPLDLGGWPKLARLRETLTSRPAFEAAGPVA
jgi:glutathione S-transferase